MCICVHTCTCMCTVQYCNHTVLYCTVSVLQQYVVIGEYAMYVTTCYRHMTICTVNAYVHTYTCTCDYMYSIHCTYNYIYVNTCTCTCTDTHFFLMLCDKIFWLSCIYDVHLKPMKWFQRDQYAPPIDHNHLYLPDPETWILQMPKLQQTQNIIRKVLYGNQEVCSLGLEELLVGNIMSGSY